MKKCIGLLLVVVHSVGYGDETPPVPCEHIVHVASTWDAKNNTQELTPSEIEGIENILNAFVNMIKGVAHVMANPDSKLAAWTGITDIITSSFKVITELAKHKHHVIEDIMICDYERRGPYTQSTLESMECELMAQQTVQVDPNKQLIASNVANMIGNCANIIADPHNPHVVGSNVAHILSSIINIAVQLGKRTPHMDGTMYEAMCAALLADQEFMEEMSTVLQYKVSRVLLVRSVLT